MTMSLGKPLGFPFRISLCFAQDTCFILPPILSTVFGFGFHFPASLGLGEVIVQLCILHVVISDIYRKKFQLKIPLQWSEHMQLLAQEE